MLLVSQCTAVRVGFVGEYERQDFQYGEDQGD